MKTNHGQTEAVSDSISDTEHCQQDDGIMLLAAKAFLLQAEGSSHDNAPFQGLCRYQSKERVLSGSLYQMDPGEP